jgi:hypothetical protein
MFSVIIRGFISAKGNNRVIKQIVCYRRRGIQLDRWPAIITDLSNEGMIIHRFASLRRISVWKLTGSGSVEM